jgi:anti-sigma B factor antagonist
VTIDVTEIDDITTQVVIQDEMTIYTVLEQKNILVDQLKAEKVLQLDLSKVSEIDSAGMQLLIFMKQEAIRLNNQFSLVHHSQAVVEVLELLGLTSFFGNPVVISADWNNS